MKFRLRMLITLVLILAILTPSGVVFSQINEDWDVVRQKYNIPEYIQRFSSNDFEFNLDIWKDKGLTVYGDAFVFSKNDFKPVPEGYYTNPNGQKGEYRYHGFTAEGNRYSNIDFPNDADTGLLASQKRWIFEP
jgi:hypothetical protein